MPAFNSRLYGPRLPAQAFVAAMIVMLAGCLPDSSLSDLRRFTREAYQDRSPEVDPLPAMEPYEGFRYGASDEPEPFSAENLRDTEPQQNDLVLEKFQPERRREHLEQFPLDALTMVGAMFQETGSWALIGTPDGGTHRVTLGNHLGQQNGKIIEINEQDVVLREVVRGPAGQWEERKTTITLLQ
ncbi:MAG: type IV pilus assembly protein PilP [Parasphingorhabdus sp.]|jgi:type IV pilus assembly protein PilP